jgi:1,4-dihydroxy-2-naphthoate octaprenyltransferase
MNLAERLIVLFIVLQAISVAAVWTLNATTVVEQGEFAIFLAINLLSFAAVVYVYTRGMKGTSPRPLGIFIYCIALGVLIFGNIFLA